MTANKLDNSNEKRRFSRFKIPLNVFINSRGINNDHLSNISEGGACFTSSHIFQKNDFIFIHFNGAGESSLKHVKFSILGKVVWHENIEDHLSEYGAQFTFYDDPFCTQQQSTMKEVMKRYSS